MKKIVKPMVIGIVFTVLALVGARTSAMDTAAEEPTPLDKFTMDILESHKAEVEAKAVNDAKCKIHYDEKIKNTRNHTREIRNKMIEESKPDMTLIGTYQLTAYVATGSPCASGVYPTVGRTVACNSLALGTKIYIEGLGEYVVEDTGGMGGGVIDVFVSDYGSAINFGRQTANVYIIEENK